MYILANNSGKYICKDSKERFSITTNSQLATSWETREKAENVRKNCLTKTLKNKGFTVKEIKEEVKEETKEEKVAIDLEHFEENLKDILDDVSHIDTLISDIPTKLSTLFHAQSIVDREISDIHHWIEFDRFNAYEGYKAFALLKSKLIHRRQIKDGIEILRAVSDMETTIQNLRNRSYTPRELEELFGG